MSVEHKTRYILSAAAWLGAALCSIGLLASAISVAAHSAAAAAAVSDSAGQK